MVESAVVTIKDKSFKPFIEADKIQSRIVEISQEINRDFERNNPLFLSILNGSFMFAADLMKSISIDCEISFVKLASYQGTKSTGNVMTLIGLDAEIEDRHIVIIEDIVDTGKTLSELLPNLKRHRPESIRIASLILKPEALQHDIHVDYVGFEIPNDFIVGYGLDYDGLGRNLRDIYQLKS